MPDNHSGTSTDVSLYIRFLRSFFGSPSAALRPKNAPLPDSPPVRLSYSTQRCQFSGYKLRSSPLPDAPVRSSHLLLISDQKSAPTLLHRTCGPLFSHFLLLSHKK